MLSMKFVNQIILTFVIICIFFMKTKCHYIEEDDYDDDYDDLLEPISKMTHSELTNEVVNKSFVLELFSKDSFDDESEEDSEYVSQYDYVNDEPKVEHKDKSILMGKLTVSVETKILKNGKQIGPSIVENQTIFLEEDELDEEGDEPVLVLLHETKVDTEDVETIKEYKVDKKVTHEPIKDATSKDESKEENVDEAKDANSTDTNTTNNSEETEDSTKLKPSRVTEDSEEEASNSTTTETTTTTEKSSSIFDFINDLPFMSSAVGIRSSIVNNLIFIIPICIASLFK